MERDEKRVREFAAAFREHDTERLRPYLTDDVVIHNHPQRPVEGLVRVLAVFRHWFTCFPKGPIDLGIIGAAPAPGGRVLVEQEASLYNRRGEVISGLPAMSEFRLRDGRIAHWRIHRDRTDWLQRLGEKVGALEDDLPLT